MTKFQIQMVPSKYGAQSIDKYINQSINQRLLLRTGFSLPLSGSQKRPLEASSVKLGSNGSIEKRVLATFQKKTSVNLIPASCCVSAVLTDVESEKD